jgi:predicted RNA-binding Zn-ribbon protein involved in translation (DUF1610 family)
MKEVIEAYKDGDVIIPKTEVVKICATCEHDIDEAEITAGSCSNCGESLGVRQSVSVWATSVPSKDT